MRTRVEDLLTLLLLLFLSCGHSEKKDRYSIDANAQGEPVMESHCYLQVTRGAARIEGADTIPGPVDSLYIRLDIFGELANGVYNWLPGEKDSKTGSFMGTLENGIVTALYKYDAEGMYAKEEVLFTVESGGLRIGTGELVESEGVWLFKDKSRAEFGELIPEVPCMR